MQDLNWRKTDLFLMPASKEVSAKLEHLKLRELLSKLFPILAEKPKKNYLSLVE
jgi:hypothetical protein